MGACLLFLTNLIFPFAALGVLVGFFFSPRRRVLGHLYAELKERFGWVPADKIPQEAVWLHCASVGEVNAVKGLICQLKQFYAKPILLTMTWIY